MYLKTTALAVAALASTAAFAQSNVTIYGIADVGFSHRGDNRTAGVGSRSSVDSGQQSDTRLGFRGTEDLGNGLTAVFTLETGIAADNGGFTLSGLAFGRQSFAGLSSTTLGTLLAGRQYSPQFTLLSATDPFAVGTVGKANNIYNVTSRYNNLVKYVSPNFGGFGITAGYTNSGLQNESAVQATTEDRKVWMISPVYSNGPLMVGVNFHQEKGSASNAKTKVWDLAASYDLKVAKLAAAYGTQAISTANSGWAASDAKSYLLGATVPVGVAGNVLVSYSQRKADFNNQKASQWALGYTHDLSKRTNLYAVYADISNKNGATADTGDNANTGLGYQNGFQLGMRHKF